MKIISDIKIWIQKKWLIFKNRLAEIFKKKETIMSEATEITQDLLNQVVNLASELQPLSQGAFGFFTTKTRHAVSYQDPIIRKKVQDELDHAVSLLAIAHVMAIFEDAFPNKYWEEIIEDSEDYDRIMAYKHIRNCTINGFTENRSNDNEHTYFNKVMNSANPLKGVKSFDDEKVFLEESAGNYAHSDIVTLTNKIMVELHKRVV